MSCSKPCHDYSVFSFHVVGRHCLGLCYEFSFFRKYSIFCLMIVFRHGVMLQQGLEKEFVCDVASLAAMSAWWKNFVLCHVWRKRTSISSKYYLLQKRLRSATERFRHFGVLGWTKSNCVYLLANEIKPSLITLTILFDYLLPSFRKFLSFSMKKIPRTM